MKDKVKKFLNDLTWDEVRQFRRLLMTKEWKEMLEKRACGGKVE